MPLPRALRRKTQPIGLALRAVLVSALLGALVIPAGAGATIASERRLAGLVNVQRLAAGAAPLELATPLSRSAGDFVAWALPAGAWGHEADGRTATQRAGAAGWPGGHVAENLAIAGSAEQAVGAWLASPAHARNLLDPARSTIGIAERAGHWVAVFGDACPAGLDEACGLTGDFGDPEAAAPAAAPAQGGATAIGSSAAAGLPARLVVGRPQVRGLVLRVRVRVDPAAAGRLALQITGPRGWQRTVVPARARSGAARVRLVLPRRGRYRLQARFSGNAPWGDARRTRPARAG